MAKFIRLILGIIGVLLSINFMVYALIGIHSESRFYDYYKVVDKLDKTHFKYLVTGDSHANAVWRRGDNPEVLDMTFPGDNQVDINKKIAFLKINGISYDAHLYQADEHILTSYRERVNNNDLSSNFDSRIFWIKTRKLLPLFTDPRVGESILNKFRGNKGEDEENKPENSVVDTSNMEQRCKVQYNTSFSNKMMNYIRRNLTVEAESNTPVVLIHYPLYGPYFELVRKTETFETLQDSLSLVEEQAKLEQLDYIQAICSPNSFSDQDHLNTKGAKLVREYSLNTLEQNSFKVSGCLD